MIEVYHIVNDWFMIFKAENPEGEVMKVWEVGQMMGGN